MIAKLIRWSIATRFLVLLASTQEKAHKSLRTHRCAHIASQTRSHFAVQSARG